MRLNVLNEEKRQQGLAAGRLGWLLRRIQPGWPRLAPKRLATILELPALPSGLQVAGASARQLQLRPTRCPRLWRGVDSVRDPGGTRRRTDAGARFGVAGIKSSTRPTRLSTDSAPGKDATASACEPYRDFIELSLSKGRNAKAISSGSGRRPWFHLVATPVSSASRAPLPRNTNSRKHVP